MEGQRSPTAIGPYHPVLVEGRRSRAHAASWMVCSSMILWCLVTTCVSPLPADQNARSSPGAVEGSSAFLPIRIHPRASASRGLTGIPARRRSGSGLRIGSCHWHTAACSRGSVASGLRLRPESSTVMRTVPRRSCSWGKCVSLTLPRRISRPLPRSWLDTGEVRSERQVVDRTPGTRGQRRGIPRSPRQLPD